jgi:hypothetical protein
LSPAIAGLPEVTANGGATSVAAPPVFGIFFHGNPPISGAITSASRTKNATGVLDAYVKMLCTDGGLAVVSTR